MRSPKSWRNHSGPAAFLVLAAAQAAERHSNSLELSRAKLTGNQERTPKKVRFASRKGTSSSRIFAPNLEISRTSPIFFIYLLMKKKQPNRTPFFVPSTPHQTRTLSHPATPPFGRPKQTTSPTQPARLRGPGEDRVAQVLQRLPRGGVQGLDRPARPAEDRPAGRRPGAGNGREARRLARALGENPSFKPQARSFSFLSSI